MKRLIITGNVGQDPELRLDNSGNQFTTFSVAVSVGTKQNPKTDWVDINCNGKLAEVAYTYAKKGTKVLIDGYPTANAYINKDNIPVGTLKLYANSLELLKFANSDRVEEHSVVSAADGNTHEIPF